MNWNVRNKQRLIDAFISLKNSDETKRFLRDLFTPSEIEEFAKRFQAAEMLLNKVPYTKIEEKTGLSSTTIARVAKYLFGKQGGYAQVLNKLDHHTSSTLGRGLS